MQNFTEELKNEIISLPLCGEEGTAAFLSAFLRTSGSILSRGGFFGFEIVTESERTAVFLNELLEREFGLSLTVSGAKQDAMRKKDKLSFECVNEKTEELLEKLSLIGDDGDGKYVNFGIDDEFFAKKISKICFLRGAFLGGGSCTLPDDGANSTGYHFETVFSNKVTASDFCELLCGFEILAKLVARKDKWVVYVKSKDVISDLLDAMGCVKGLEKLSRVVELRDKQNNANRAINCSVSNIDRALTASAKQVRSIEVISRTIGLQALDKQLFEAAECRLADKNASMQELADRLNVSKSCLNHRFRKLGELADSLED